MSGDRTSYEVIVLGGGPAGYVAALRAAQAGFTTACIETRRDVQGRAIPGGVCLNSGCIPSKTLLERSARYADIHSGRGMEGIHLGEATLDLGAMMAHKDKAVRTLTAGIHQLFRRYGVELLTGEASLAGRQQVRLQYADETRILGAGRIVVATGVRARAPEGEPNDPRILTPGQALTGSVVPKRLGILGWDAVALELAVIWQRLGSTVTCLAHDDWLPILDQRLARTVRHALNELGITFRRLESPPRVAATDAGITLTETADKAPWDALVVADGYVPNTEGLGLERLGIRCDPHGFIRVDGDFRTNLPEVYAIGDVIGPPFRAHKAFQEAEVLCERWLGRANAVNYEAIPWALYTRPEVAWVGPAPADYEARGRRLTRGSFPFAANGRAHSLADVAGSAVVYADAETDRLVAVQIVGPGAVELINQAAGLIELQASAEDLARIAVAHPSLSETLREAALAAREQPLHQSP